MPARPKIFISAASRDLRSCRQLVRDALLTLGCVPVVQDHFPPGAGEVRAMLREKIAGCQAVIHLAGECYGFEPQERAPGDWRRALDPAPAHGADRAEGGAGPVKPFKLEKLSAALTS